jgi:hypothetical protein
MGRQDKRRGAIFTSVIKLLAVTENVSGDMKLLAGGWLLVFVTPLLIALFKISSL